MKKLFILSLFVFGLAAVNVNAQTEVKVSTEKAADMAAKVAAADENIVAKVCQHSGTTSYYQKSVCEKSGAVKMTKVIFDAESGAFVAAEKAGGKSCAGDKGAKSCSKKGAKGACCKGGKKGGACCKGGKKSCSRSNSKTE